MRKKLVIIGSGDFGREVIGIVNRINVANKEEQYDLVGFVDDNIKLRDRCIGGLKVLGDIQWLNNYQGETLYAVCSIGTGQIRKRVIEKITNKNIKYPVLIDPDVSFLGGESIGEGTIISSNNSVSIDVNIGRHVIINLSCTIGHDVTIDDFSVINPGTNLSGFVHIGECTDIGTGTKIIQHINVGKNAVTGAGAVVIRDIDDEDKVAGVPAKSIKR